VKIDTIQLKEIYDHVVHRLDTELSSNLHYHSTAHTLYVLDKVSHIGKKESESEKELILLKIAALFHDIGFIENALNHEAISCRIMEEDIKKWEVPQKEIEAIKTIIMATKIPQNPQNQLAKILADADLEYIGTGRYYEMSELLYRELFHRNPNLTQKEWLDIQISFLESHSFHTDFCKRYKEHRKRKTLEELKSIKNRYKT
jgi:uncharacterized protein